jgi:hypothetical protein
MAKFERRNVEVDAIQHDGSNESALRLEAWVLGGGGKAVAYLKGSIDFAQDNAFVKIFNSRAQNLVGPGAWIVRVQEGAFYPVSRDDFDILYKPMLPPEPERPLEVLHVVYRSTTPDGNVWAEASREDDVLEPERTDLKYWKMAVYRTNSGWQEYDPYPPATLTPLSDSAVEEMNLTDE